MGNSETQKLGSKRDRSYLYREDYEANPKFCLYCGEKLPYEKRSDTFCNRSCGALYNHRVAKRPRENSERCSCGNIKKPTNKYCDECIEKRVFSRPPLEELKSDKARRRLLIEQRGQRCEECGLTEWRGHPIPIQLHHIDGNSDNNVASNLRLLCCNCHALTEDYKGAKKGKDGARQRMRRQRYANGQTW